MNTNQGYHLKIHKILQQSFQNITRSLTKIEPELGGLDELIFINVVNYLIRCTYTDGKPVHFHVTCSIDLHVVLALHPISLVYS